MAPKTQIHLFNTLVKPILNYACEIWGSYDAKPLEVLHTKFLRYVLGVRQSTPNSYVSGELGEFPLKLDRQIRVIKYWFKVLKSPNESLIKKVYQKLKLKLGK